MPIQLISEQTVRLRKFAKENLKPKPEERQRAAGFLARIVAPNDEKASEPTSSAYHHGALTLAFEHRVVVHQLRKTAVRLVTGTRLRSAPTEAPRLLKKPWLIETARPNEGERLFGDVYALAGYFAPEHQAWVLIGWHALPDGRVMSDGALWRQKYIPMSEESLNELNLEWRDGAWVATNDDPEEIRRAEVQTWGDQAVNFATVFGILLETDNAPLRIRDERSPLPKLHPARREAPLPSDAWLIRQVYLEEQRPRREHRESAVSVPLDKEGKELAEVQVTGHLKRQRIGQGREQIKWIWIHTYGSHRWSSTNPVKIVVSGPPHN